MYHLQMNAAKARGRRRIEMVWLGAVLHRAEKVPPLAELLDGKQPLEPEELQAQMRALAETLPKRSWDEWRRMSSEP
jgi:hypothetical protein